MTDTMEKELAEATRHAAGMREGDVLCRVGLSADRVYDVDIAKRTCKDCARTYRYNLCTSQR